MKKGQNFRLFVGTQCVAGAKSCTIEDAAELEDISTKDSDNMAKESTLKSTSWNGSVDALVLNETDSTGRTLSFFLSQVISGSPVLVKFTETQGAQNRTEITGSELSYSGTAIINDLTIKATAGEVISLSAKLIGWGPLTKNVKTIE